MKKFAYYIDVFYNPPFRLGQRAHRHGFNAPVKRWKSRLEEAMDQIEKSKN